MSAVAAVARKAHVPELPKPVWLVLGADALSALGSGLTIPYLLIYFHSARGIPLAVAGVAVSMVAVGSLAGNPIGGTLADRHTPRFALIVGLALAAAGTGAVIAVDSAWQAFVAAGLLGLGTGIIFPTLDALLATTVAEDQRSAAFSVRFMTMNAGLGIGALIASMLVSLHSPGTFVFVYVIDAITYLAAIPILMMVRTAEPVRSSEPALAEVEAPGDVEAPGEVGVPAAPAPRGYRAVFRDRTFRSVLVLTLFVVLVSYGQFASGFPAFATRAGGISAHMLSLAYAANTLTIVLCQLLVLRALEGWRRTRAIALACACWATCWGLTVISGHVHSSTGAAIGFVLAMAIFALGETLLSPALGPIVNDLAPDHLRGRYNGSNTLALTLGFLIGPSVAGLALSLGAGTFLFASLIVACGLTAIGAIRLERHLPVSANRVHSGPEAEAAEDQLAVEASPA
jgi:MFS family permease